jgi:hypothetical protein
VGKYDGMSEAQKDAEAAWWMVENGWLEVHPDGQRVRFTQQGWAEYTAMHLDQN